MRQSTLLASVAGVAISILTAVSANAQATRTWVSGVGDDVNPCSRTAPCKTFAGAISKTAAGGEINCLDPGGFGAVTITKSMTIDCTGTMGSILAAGTNGVNVNDSATATPGTIVVRLRGLSIHGAGTGFIGINYVSGAALHVEDTVVFGFRTGTAFGLRVANSINTSKTFVTNTVLTSNGTGAVGGGVQVRPTAAASAQLVLVRTQMNQNVFGLAADGTGTTGGVNVQVFDSTANGNTQTGILGTSNANGLSVMVHNSSANHNLVGISASGAGTNVRVGSSSVTGNNTGLSGAAVLSYLNNQVNGNAAGEAFGGPVPGGLK